jgi:hypothetical protein
MIQLDINLGAFIFTVKMGAARGHNAENHDFKITGTNVG